MKKKILLTLLCFSLGLISTQAAQLTVSLGQITTAIEKQMPVDKVESFPADYGKLFCFTRIAGAHQETQITHVWYYQEDEMARVVLPVKSSDWRTYSSKRFLPQWRGQWRVKILDAEENELATIPFVLE